MPTLQTSSNNTYISNSQCENCDTLLQGPYCHNCGQSRQTVFRFFGSILHDLLDNLFSYDSRIYRTLVPLMTKPGYICEEYLSGHRNNFLPPFRLYLFASILFFLIVPLLNDTTLSIESDSLDPEATIVTNEITDLEQAEVDINLPFYTDIQKREFFEKIRNIIKDQGKDLIKATLNRLPTMMFLLLPVFAFVLKIFYLFSYRYYMEHVIIVLFSQSYIFFMLLFILALDKGHVALADIYPGFIITNIVAGSMISLCYYLIPVNLYLLQKRIYGQSHTVTLVKFILISLVYFSLLGIMVAMTVFWNIMT